MGYMTIQIWKFKFQQLKFLLNILKRYNSKSNAYLKKNYLFSPYKYLQAIFYQKKKVFNIFEHNQKLLKIIVF